MNRYPLLTTIALLALVTAVQAAQYRVDASGGGDFLAIGPAVAFADSGDVIMVAPGTYSGEDNRGINFMGKDLTLMSEAGPEFTVIDLDRQDRAFIFINGESYYSLIEGFTIMQGRRSQGGALFIAGSAPVIHDCIFYDNYADLFGGAVYLGTESEAEIVECHFEDNYAENYGGAIYCHQAAPRIRWNTFTENRADLNGGAISCKEST